MKNSNDSKLQRFNKNHRRSVLLIAGIIVLAVLSIVYLANHLIEKNAFNSSEKREGKSANIGEFDNFGMNNKGER